MAYSFKGRCIRDGCDHSAAHDNSLPTVEFYICGDHMAEFTSLMGQLGVPGRGPSHMPDCPAGPHIIISPDFETQYNHLTNIGRCNAVIKSDDGVAGQATEWSTECCVRAFVIMNISGKVYAVNPMQLQVNGFYVEVIRPPKKRTTAPKSRATAPPPSSAYMGSVMFIVYGKQASRTAEIDPGEVFTAPDPDGKPQTYIFVWNQRTDAERFVAAQGAGDSLHVREVEFLALVSFSTKNMLWFALDPDERGRTRKLVKPFEHFIVLDSGVSTTAPGPISGGSGCFVRGTMVLVPGGIRPIEDLRIGERVLSFEPTAQAAVIRRIRRIRSTRASSVVRIVTTAGTVTCTPDHHLESVGGRVAAAFVKAGDRLRRVDGIAEVISVQPISEPREVFNLYVEGVSTFMPDGFVAHSHGRFGPLRSGIERIRYEGEKRLRGVATWNQVLRLRALVVWTRTASAAHI